jgi:hypothetical protein
MVCGARSRRRAYPPAERSGPIPDLIDRACEQIKITLEQNYTAREEAG